MSELKIKFQSPLIIGTEQENLNALMADPSAFIDRAFSKRCLKWIEDNYTSHGVFLTCTGTAALEIACLSEGLGVGDEVIMPSYTYVSTANAFVRHGVIPVFTDIAAGDCNITPELILKALTPRTRAVVVVHYGGVACDMDPIIAICREKNLILIEDAAHSFNAKYKGKLLGTLGDYGAVSFDHSKNIHCGQGGMLLVNKEGKKEAASFVFENGTNRNEFLAGTVPYFEWVSKGSKYILSELNAAFLLAQLEGFSPHLKHRKDLWDYYYKSLSNLDERYFDMPEIAAYAGHNAHIFYIKMKNSSDRTKLQQYLYQQGIQTSFHFIPLHSSVFGKRVGKLSGSDDHTTRTSASLLRLPLHNLMNTSDIDFVSSCIARFNP